MKQLRRAKEGRKIAGVCQGMANLFDINVSYIRLAWIFISVLPFITFFGTGVLYLAFAILIPEEEDYIDV